MKAFFTQSTLAISFAISLSFAQEAKPPRQEAIIVNTDESTQTVWIDAAKDGKIQFLETENSVEKKIVDRNKLASVFLLEVKAFKDALDAYQRGEYEAALAQFEKVKTDYANMADLPNNVSSRSEFYELECLRQLGRLDEMIKRKGAYLFKGLELKYEKDQLELFPFWEAVHNKSWQRLEVLCEQIINKPMIASSRAQIAYCYGLALAELQKTNAALNMLGAAITSDHSPNKPIARKAIFRSLKLLSQDPDFIATKDLFGTDNYDSQSLGAFRLQEAGRLVHYYQTVMIGAEALPNEYAGFSKYHQAPGATKNAPAKAPK